VKVENLVIKEDINIMRIFEGKDDLLTMLQRDKDFYEG